jgi:DnaK suppressor protein
MASLSEKSNGESEMEEKMKEGDLDFFKTLLSNWMEELLEQADSTRLGMKDPSDNLADPSDRATFESDRNFLLRIRDRESRLFKKIISALDRIKDGTYGICEMCGEEISINRLKARPVTTYCIRCKARLEAVEKTIGE